MRTPQHSRPKKICVVTCYKDPDYIRGRAIRAMLRMYPDRYSVIDVKNKKKGLLRYPEVIIKTLITRIKYRPDVFILTFRGYELLPLLRIITLGRPLVFDELINLVEWTVLEHKKLRQDSVAAKILKSVYRFWLKSADVVLADTVSHAEFSARIMNIDKKKYASLPVSTDEEVFKSTQSGKKHKKAEKFTVFYYGSMLPLHGVDVVLKAASLLNNDISVIMVGGGKKAEDAVAKAKADGANVVYYKWIRFEELPKHMQAADICLAGPFSGTVQSQYVITGKAYQLLHLGVPIIVGENKESHIFTDKKDALVVKQADAKALADAITWGYEHRDKIRQIGNNGKLLYEQKLSNKVVSAKLNELLAGF